MQLSERCRAVYQALGKANTLARLVLKTRLQFENCEGTRDKFGMREVSLQFAVHRYRQ